MTNDSLGACGGGGLTLVMKIDGTKVLTRWSYGKRSDFEIFPLASLLSVFWITLNCLTGKYNISCHFNLASLSFISSRKDLDLII